MTTYLLEWPGRPPASATAPAHPCLILLVSSPRSAPGFATSRMVYVQEAYRIDYFANHQWADTPAGMLAPILSRAVGGLFRTVVMAPALVEPHLRLESQVLRLQQIFRNDASSVLLELRIDLFDLVNRRSLGSRVFSVSEPAPSRDPYGGVVAANRALARVLNELIDLLQQWIHVDTFRCESDPGSIMPVPAPAQ
jgi:cholesterol transport system auxiliary component